MKKRFINFFESDILLLHLFLIALLLLLLGCETDRSEILNARSSSDLPSTERMRTSEPVLQFLVTPIPDFTHQTMKTKRKPVLATEPEISGATEPRNDLALSKEYELAKVSIFAGKSLAGIDLGYTLSEVEALYGPAKAGTGENLHQYYYTDLGLGIELGYGWLDSGQKAALRVIKIAILKGGPFDLTTTPGGLGIGSSEFAIFDEFGFNYEFVNDDIDMIYEYTTQGITFWYNGHDKVFAIKVFRPKKSD